MNVTCDLKLKSTFSSCSMNYLFNVFQIWRFECQSWISYCRHKNFSAFDAGRVDIRSDDIHITEMSLRRSGIIMYQYGCIPSMLFFLNYTFYHYLTKISITGQKIIEWRIIHGEYLQYNTYCFSNKQYLNINDELKGY